MTKHSYAAKAFSLLLALVLTLSLAVNSAAAVSFQDMNPKDDALLGTKFPVDATITLVTDENGKDVSLSIPVSGMTKDALAAAVSTGTVSLSLERDDSRPYVNEELFPYRSGGAVWYPRQCRLCGCRKAFLPCISGHDLPARREESKLRRV